MAEALPRTLYHPALNGGKASDWLRPIPCQREGNKLPKGAYQSGDGYSTGVHLSEHLACIPSRWRESSHVSSQGKEAASVTHDIYNIICEFLPGNTVEGLRSRLCKFLNANLDYFCKLFEGKFGPKDINIFDYIGKQIRHTTIPNHNAIFAISTMIKESFFIIGVRHNWKSTNTSNIDIVLRCVGNKKFYPVMLHKDFSYKKAV